MKTNRTRQRLRSGETCIGTMVRDIRSPQVVQLAAAAGLDFIIMDTEHGPFSMETVADFAAVARYEDVTLIVRVPDNLYHLLARPLDNGAEGLLCPRVDTRAEVEAIVRATRYAPEGNRGVSISGIATAYRPTDAAEYLRAANENTLVIVQIEAVETLEHLDEILSVPGIDATLIGPADLSQTMGIPGQFQHPRMRDAFQAVIEACNRHGVAPGLHLQDADQLRQWMARGMRLVTYKTDFRLLADACRAAVQALRAPAAAKA